MAFGLARTNRTDEDIQTPADAVDEAAGVEPALTARAEKLIESILSAGVDGVGRFKGAQEIAEEHRTQHVDVDKAIDRLIATHVRVVGATGFATGLGGLITLPVTIPTDLAVFYMYAGRCAAAVAHLRGYDVTSDEVRSVVLLSLLGAGGVAVAGEAGIQLGTKAAFAVLKKVPGKVLVEINKKVGFRLITKAGTTGAINLSKFVPVVGAGVGASVNVVGMRGIAGYAKKNFPKT
ncbi:EcsC family protein [Geodermatophilus sp. SYSU D00705]